MGERADEVVRREAPGDGDDEPVDEVVEAPEESEEPEAIRGEIEQTRSEMSDTIDAIQRKLSPEAIAEQAKDAVREATVGKAEEVVSNVTNTVQGFFQGGSSSGQGGSPPGGTVVDTLKRNPVPTALAGLGLALLWKNRQQAPQPPPEYRPYATPANWDEGWRRGGQGSGINQPYGGQPYPGGQPYAGGQAYSYATATPQGSGGVGETVDRAKEAAGDLAGQAQDSIGHAAERVQSVAQTAGYRAGDAGSELIDIIRQNPLPAALVGAGLAWIIANRASSGGSGGGQRYGYAASSGSYSTGAYRYGQPYGQEEQGVVQRAQERAGQVAGDVQDRAGQVAGDVQARAGQVADEVQARAGQVGETVSNLGDEAQQRAMQARYKAEELLGDNPLAMGAIALALGAAVGLSVPQSRQENRLMGEARDTLVERAQGMAQETLGKVQQVAQEVTSEATQVAERAARDQGLVKSGDSQPAAEA